MLLLFLNYFFFLSFFCRFVVSGGYKGGLTLQIIHTRRARTNINLYWGMEARKKNLSFKKIPRVLTLLIHRVPMTFWSVFGTASRKPQYIRVYTQTLCARSTKYKTENKSDNANIDDDDDGGSSSSSITATVTANARVYVCVSQFE